MKDSVILEAEMQIKNFGIDFLKHALLAVTEESESDFVMHR